MLVCSIDIGVNNLAFYVEEVAEEHLTLLRNCDIPFQNRYKPDGTTTPEFQSLLNEVYLSGDVKLLVNNKICKPGYKKECETDHFDLGLCLCMKDVLDEYSDWWDKADVIIVEKQMRINYLCTRLAQNCESYFLFKYGKTKKVIEFPSHLKTTILGAPKVPKKSGKGFKSMEKPARKKWAVDEASSILALRDDFTTLATLGPYTKAYDKSDCIVQLQAWKYLTYISTTPPPSDRRR